MTQKHICRWYSGRIRDVTIRKRDKSIYCRKCGIQLQESGVDPYTLSLIKKKLQ